MTKKEYLNELKKELKKNKISEIEATEILNDYYMMYDDALDTNINDNEVQNRLGEPAKIAKELRKNDLIDAYNPYSKRNRKNALITSAPILSLIVFLALGFTIGYWQFIWLVFLWIPLSSIFFSRKRGFFSTLAKQAPFLALIGFFIFGFFNLWHPGWLIFLIIPLFSAINRGIKD